MTKCIPDPACCPRSTKCAMRDMLATAEMQMLQVFKEHTLEDLVALEREKQIEPTVNVANLA